MSYVIIETDEIFRCLESGHAYYDEHAPLHPLSVQNVGVYCTILVFLHWFFKQVTVHAELLDSDFLFALQMIFTRYDVDQSGTIRSFEMRNAVQDAGEAIVTFRQYTVYMAFMHACSMKFFNAASW